MPFAAALSTDPITSRALDEACAIYRDLGATRWLERIDEQTHAVPV